jgi:high-affinity iron transporter
LADHGRAQERSVFSLQQIITQGVAGTSMPGFTQLTDDDRWAIAYFASTLSYGDDARQAGAKLWVSRPELHAVVPTLAALSQTSETALAKTSHRIARPLIAYLRSAPGVLDASGADSLPVAKAKLKDSVAALQRGDVPQASRLALAAYLDGFEPVEPALAAKNKALFEDIERTMARSACRRPRRHRAGADHRTAPANLADRSGLGT